ncbi:uncharacterized protein LOC115455961 [Manduca sexta]|uniref:Natalisin n=1 Tax=Manduca sexta TaxID=7130 RepID=A0A921YQ73_MANSE|nr:uncharacterized protein LOC115455961 [Manduca sexta]XP_030040655.1 uncharacterized protein LOC115455961 [Manduca sexta]XP_030040656.1 uncharacterized protein LOC115455961 [Manduca sexta]KAG6443591.1 hypothetical protein O3G_MSEX002930 [Manduca sexta]
MSSKLTASALLLLILSIAFVYSKDVNKTKLFNKKHTNLKPTNHDRTKRSSNGNEASTVWLNKGLQIVPESSGYNGNIQDKITSNLNTFRQLDIEPFWATRGRRDSSSTEDYNDSEYSGTVNKLSAVVCNGCPTPSHLNYRNVKISRDEYSPFWGNRGRRGSYENNDPAEVFWGSRGRREDNEPFWGNRGRRKDDPPFWGNRGRREEEPFWGNRGRRQSAAWSHNSRYEDEPFWGNRGRREDPEPFWGNRGRREDTEPFWGNRGRREDSEPFWGNRGRRKDAEPFWGTRGRRKEDLKESILTAIDNVESDIENLSRLRRSDDMNSFWANRGRDSTLKFLPSAPVKSKTLLAPNSETVHDSRIYAEQPKFILVERNSRSSAEEDPYFISRGKKYYLNYNLIKAARDRRGAIEEIVKSVRNDPYYIARGKKRREDARVNNATKHEEMQKIKDLVCSAIDLITINTPNDKVKREINENERDRRTILKKLAAQLQIDPYFVSRGKKNEENGDKDYLYAFINDVAEKCDY